MAKKACKPCASKGKSRRSLRVETPLELFARDWRPAYVRRRIREDDTDGLIDLSVACARAFAKWQAKTITKASKSRAIVSRSQNPACDPIRVAISVMESQRVQEAAALAITVSAIMILEVWLNECETPTP